MTISDSYAQRSYDRMLAAGPPEPATADVTVEYTVWIDRDHLTLSGLRQVVGGEAHFASGRDGDLIEVEGSTLVEDVESTEEAEEILRNLLAPLENVVDLDNLVTDAQDPFEVDEPDWDAIEKDRRIEEDWA